MQIKYRLLKRFAYITTVMFVIAVLFSSCNKERNTCYTYQEGINRGEVPYKTSTVQITDSLIYTLDYVRDAGGKFFNYGYLETGGEKFREIFRAIDTTYNMDNVGMITLYGQNDDISKGVMLKRSNMNGYLVSYIDSNRNAMIDYRDITTGIKQSYRVSNYYATVKNYFATAGKDTVAHPSIIDISNKDFNAKNIVMLKKSEDALYQMVNKH